MPGLCCWGSPTKDNERAPNVAKPSKTAAAPKPVSPALEAQRIGGSLSNGPQPPESEFAKVRSDSDGSALPNGHFVNGHTDNAAGPKQGAKLLQDNQQLNGLLGNDTERSNTAQRQPNGQNGASIAESSTVEDMGDHFVSIDFREEIPTGSTKRVPRPATLQELTSKYKRGNFDPANPMGRMQNERNSGSTPSPKTPPQSARATDDVNSGRTDSDESAPKDERNLMTTMSTLSNYTTRSRPQPVSELQGLLGSLALSPSVLSEAAQSDKARRQSTLSVSFTSRASASDIMTTRGLSPRASRDQLTSEQSRNSLASPRNLLKGVKSSVGKRSAELATPITSVSASQELHSVDSCPLRGHERFRVVNSLEHLGRHVYSCHDLQHEKVAVIVKLLPRGPSNAKAAEQEIANLHLCSHHPHLIRLHEVFLTDDYLGIALEHAEGGNLVSYIKRHQSSKTGKGISEDRAKWLFYQIAIAVEFCQKQGIASRQLRLDNVLLAPSGAENPSKSSIPTVKLGHFGFGAEDQTEPLHRSTCGAAQCLAPESIAGGLYDGKFGDIWSMGVLLFALLTGTYPFSRLSDKDLDQKVATRKLFARIMNAEFDLPQHISREAQDLLQQMLREEADKRIKIDEILAHDFFKSDKKQSKMQIINRSLLQTSPGRDPQGLSQSDDDAARLLKEASKIIRPTRKNNAASSVKVEAHS